MLGCPDKDNKKNTQNNLTDKELLLTCKACCWLVVGSRSPFLASAEAVRGEADERKKGLKKIRSSKGTGATNPNNRCWILNVSLVHTRKLQSDGVRQRLSPKQHAVTSVQSHILLGPALDPIGCLEQ